jgi:hypothetical protein
VRAVLARIALAFGSVTLLLGGLELVGLALGLPRLVDVPVFRMRTTALICRFEPRHIDKVCDAGRWRDQRDPQRRKVFAIGGSSVAGYHVEGRNIPHFLRQRLESLQPGGFAVYNLALACKDSIYVRSCALRALEADPVALVVYEGHNDFSGHTGSHPRASIWMAEYGYPLFRLERLLGHTRFWTLLATRGSGIAALDRTPAGRLEPEQAQRARQQILENLLSNYELLIRRAAERGTLVVLVTLVSNLEEFPEPRERWDAVLAEADAAPGSASPWLASYAAGIRAERAGRRAEALAHFASARDARPLTRAPGLLNPALRELAAAHPNVVLVDFERDLEQVGLKEGIGCNFFGNQEYCDGIHPNERTSQMIGRAAATALLTRLLREKTEHRAVPLDPAGRGPGKVRPEHQRGAPRRALQEALPGA